MKNKTLYSISGIRFLANGSKSICGKEIEGKWSPKGKAVWVKKDSLYTLKRFRHLNTVSKIKKIKTVSYEVEVYDCGVADHYHTSMKSAANCKRKTEDPLVNAGLTDYQKFKILELTLTLSMKELGERFGVSVSRISQICYSTIRKYPPKILDIDNVDKGINNPFLLSMIREEVEEDKELYRLGYYENRIIGYHSKDEPAFRSEYNEYLVGTGLETSKEKAKIHIVSKVLSEGSETNPYYMKRDSPPVLFSKNERYILVKGKWELENKHPS